MKRFTVSIPRVLKVKMDRLPEVNWSEVAKKGILTKLEMLERFDKMEKRGAN